MSGEALGRYVRKELTPLSPVTLTNEQVPADLDEAYRLLFDAVRGDEHFGAAWKLGGTTAVTRRIFKVEKLYFGPLHASEILVSPPVAPGRRLHEVKGEAEIALRIAPTAAAVIAAGEAAIAAAPAGALFDAWSVALELPSSPITNLVDAGVNALVADRCASGSLVLGPATAYDGSHDWSGGKLRTEQDGVTIAEGGLEALVAAPDVCGRDFLIEAVRHGFTPKPGQWISTGGITPCVGLTPGAAVVVFHDDEPVIRFQVGLGPA